ncbi:class I SAM-dependent methyltransferase [Nakamurella flava]|uniref:Class I SAM-dependent methyltransferase n=1 Tax=Nakamurella flava TaxID=2576308 RepID=A0A4U6QFG7_9ACTN|nr:class I SAM-dependent methyltransferase [Nakamurella flava]TKV58943.1 class I SAM-dependent methyltransferase [Nakamurella flava]
MTTADIWDEAIARNYDDDCAEMFDDAVVGPTVARLAALADGGPACEFAIGTGRVAVPLWQSGVPVVGIELSAPMITQLRAKVRADQIPVTEGDMATADAAGPDVVGEYSLVFLIFNTIMNPLTQDEQVGCFVNAARHLRPGGAFVVECGVPDLRRLPPGQTAVPFEVTDTHVGVDTFDPARQLLTSVHLNRQPDGSYRRFDSHHRYVWPAELDLMARVAGLRLESRSADWSGTPFTADSAAHVSVYRRPAAD